MGWHLLAVESVGYPSFLNFLQPYALVYRPGVPFLNIRSNLRLYIIQKLKKYKHPLNPHEKEHEIHDFMTKHREKVLCCRRKHTFPQKLIFLNPL